ncbi:MAG: hypothetical protein H6R07_3092 [Proteobacteria bacterium]|nr:hypothetical protein [Pseudomonadota bacterium]
MSTKLLMGLFILILTACAGSPPARVPALRLSTEEANRAAVSAAQALRWENAVTSWREALAGYQAMDDWQGQGRARLGLGQAYARLGRDDLARGYLEAMLESAIFPEEQRASAAYQLALLDVLHHDRALELLDAARRFCGANCSLVVQFDNLAARLAAGRGDWESVRRLAQRALDAAGSMPAERSHAHRLLGEAALAGNSPLVAREHLRAALLDDRQLAEPEWLLEDYRLLEKTAALLADDPLVQEAQMRQKSICAAARIPGCSGQSGGLP